jgi:hypothetical protein
MDASPLLSFSLWGSAWSWSQAKYGLKDVQALMLENMTGRIGGNPAYLVSSSLSGLVHPSHPIFPAETTKQICLIHGVKGSKITMIARERKKNTAPASFCWKT